MLLNTHAQEREVEYDAVDYYPSHFPGLTGHSFPSQAYPNNIMILSYVACIFSEFNNDAAIVRSTCHYVTSH